MGFRRSASWFDEGEVRQLQVFRPGTKKAAKWKGGGTVLICTADPFLLQSPVCLSVNGDVMKLKVRADAHLLIQREEGGQGLETVTVFVIVQHC